MLRRSIAIAFLTLLFFNWYGYRLLSGFLQNRSDIQLEAKLDQNDYDASQLFEIRVPLNLPYHNDWQEFERYNGEIEVNGVHYKYVKRKVEKGEMVLLCLPNNEKQNLLSARDQFFKLVNDLQQNNSGKKSDQGSPNTIKTFNFEYRGGGVMYSDLGRQMTFTGSGKWTENRSDQIFPNSYYLDASGKETPNSTVYVREPEYALWVNNYRLISENFVSPGWFIKMRDLNLSIPMSVIVVVVVKVSEYS